MIRLLPAWAVVPAATRQRAVDALARLLRLTCSSQFQPPGAKRLTRCIGRPGHDGRHGAPGASWPTMHDVGGYPGEALLLKVADIAPAFGALAKERDSLAHVVLALYQTGPHALTLQGLLAEENPNLGACRELAEVWVATLHHLAFCKGIDNHPYYLAETAEGEREFAAAQEEKS